MKLEKKHWIIIGVVVAIIIVWYFFFKKKKTESSYRADQLTNGQPNFESGYVAAGRGRVVRGPAGLYKAGECPCGSGGQKGVCGKVNGVMTCREGKIILKDDTAISSFTASTGNVGISPRGGMTARSRNEQCRDAGGQPGECWNESNKRWEWCCLSKVTTSPTVSA